MASTYLNKTFSTTGNRQKFTLSMWFKRGIVPIGNQSGTEKMLFQAYQDSGNQDQIWLQSNGTINYVRNKFNGVNYERLCDYKLCDYKCSKESDYNKHLLTAKHIRLINPINKTPKYPTCGCGKEYKHMSSLWKHKKTCTHTTDEVTDINTSQPHTVTENDNAIVMLIKQNIELVKDNQEFKQLLIDQNKQMMEMAGNMGNTVNNTNNNVNSHNKFNLNVFLNEDCKNAMSLTDFVNSMNLTIEDFIQTGELGLNLKLVVKILFK